MAAVVGPASRRGVTRQRVVVVVLAAPGRFLRGRVGVDRGRWF